MSNSRNRIDIEFKLDTISEIAERFWNSFKEDKIFAFHGEMGAGKTTFIHALCELKKVTSTISSPTFSIINEYPFAEGKIYHIDLYRLRDEAEALKAGVEECFYSGDICFIEWPERAAALLPTGTVHINLLLIDEHTRRIRETDK